MSKSASTVSEFGKDNGLIHEAVVTGRKVGAGLTFWSRLAHDEGLFREIVKKVMGLVVTASPFDPVQFVGKRWALIPGEHDTRCDVITEIDFSTVLFETCLKEGEKSITGEEKLARLKAGGNIRLGLTVFAGLWTDYQAHKNNSTLECLYKEQSIAYLDFFGDVLLGLDGGRCVLSLCRDDAGVWDWYCDWLDSDWGVADRSASLASPLAS